MAATYQSITSDFVTGSGDSDVAPAKPSGLAAGDVLVAVFGTGDSRTPTTPTGWTQVATASDGSSRITVLAKVADSTDAAAASFTFAVGSFSDCGCLLFRLTGATIAGITTAFATGANDTSVTCADLAPPAAGSLFLWGMWQVTTGQAATSNRGTEAFDGSGTSAYMAAYQEPVAGSGSQTGAVITKSLFGSARAFSVAVGPSGGGDTTAPTLSSPVGTQAGSTTATIGATTDEGNGTLYGVVTISGTAPTAAQVKAGQNNGGTSAVFAGSVAVSSTGAKTISATGLTASTAYYAHLMHEDAAGNKSNVVTSAQFTTAAGASITAGSITAATVKVDLTAGASSGGTAPLTYQWYGSTTSGFTPGAGNLLSGQTSQNLSAYTVTAGSTYYFKRRTTDATSATADTSQYTMSAVAGGTGGAGRRRVW
jgi:hypothetical protein